MSDSDYLGSSATESHGGYTQQAGSPNSSSAGSGGSTGGSYFPPHPNPQYNQQHQHQQLLVRSRRADNMTPERLQNRVYWQFLAWVPFFLLLLHRQQSIEEATRGYVTVFNAVISIAVIAPVAAFNEYKDGPRLPTYISALAVGFVWGVVRVELEDLKFWRIVSMMWLGIGLGKLRYFWDVKRLSSGRGRGGNNAAAVPIHHSIFAVAVNFVERKVGIAPFFLVGEMLSVLALPSGGVTQLLDGLFGTLMFVTLPFVCISFGSSLTKYVPLLFQFLPHDYVAHHAVRTWRQLILSFVTIFLSVGFLSVGLYVYIPFVWSHSQMAGAVCVLLELATLNYHKDDERANRGRRMAGGGGAVPVARGSRQQVAN